MKQPTEAAVAARVSKNRAWRGATSEHRVAQLELQVEALVAYVDELETAAARVAALRPPMSDVIPAGTSDTVLPPGALAELAAETRAQFAAATRRRSDEYSGQHRHYWVQEYASEFECTKCKLRLDLDDELPLFGCVG